jgi:hypothetical protein
MEYIDGIKPSQTETESGGMEPAHRQTRADLSQAGV